MKKCVFCQSDIPSDSIFCPVCGKKQPEQRPSQKVPPSYYSVENGGKRIRRRAKKPTGKNIATLVAVILALVVSLSMVAHNTKGTVKGKDIIYKRNDGVYRLIPSKSTKPVSVTAQPLQTRKDSSGEFYSLTDDIVTSGNSSQVAYITENGDLYMVPVKTLSESTTDLDKKEHLVDRDVISIIGFTSDSKYLVYLDGRGNLSSWDSQQIYKLDNDVYPGMAKITQKGDIVYGRGENTLVSGLFLIDPKGENKTQLARQPYDLKAYFYHYPDIKDGMYYIEKDSYDEKNLYYVDFKSGESTEVARDVFRVIHCDANKQELVYLRRINRGRRDSQPDYYTWSNLLFPMTESDASDIYYSKAGREERIAQGVSLILYNSLENSSLVYVKVDQEDMARMHHYSYSSGNTEDFFALDGYSQVSVSKNPKGTRMAVLVRDESGLGELYTYDVSSRGVISGEELVDRNAGSIIKSDGKNEFYYSRNFDDNDEIADIYRTKGTDKEEIAVDVWANSVNRLAGQSSANFDLYYIKNPDLRLKEGQLARFSSGKEEDIGDSGMMLNPHNYDYIAGVYRGDKEIFICQTPNYSREVFDLYLYTGKGSPKLIEYDIESIKLS